MTVSDLTKYFKSVNKIIPSDLGEITLIKPVGQGGNGLVYEASLHGKKIAVKFLLTESSGNIKKSKEDRFLAEYFNVITLPFKKSIVRYFDYAVFQPTINDIVQYIPMILMELYDGSLNKLQANATEEQFEELFKFLVDTVGFVHNNGIIHRDIKPENILYQNRQFILTDFGIASYNPELFAAKAITDKAERLGNRNFSSPEQENAGTSAAETMDIYAIGQVAQWFATGSTHRGTGRKRITTKFTGLSKYDSVIDKCLQHDPAARFQNIAEIKAALGVDKFVDPFQDFYRFHDMLTRSFPRNETGTIYCDNADKINRLFENIEKYQPELDKKLWCTSNFGDHDFNLKKSPFTGRWKFDTLEYKIKDIWVHYDTSFFNDFVLVHYLKDDPFKFENKHYMGVTVVDNSFIISPSEAHNGYAEVNDEVITLSEHQTEYIEREQEEGYFLISTGDQCAHYWPNMDDIRKFIEDLLKQELIPTIDEVKVLEKKIRNRRPLEVSNRL
ncbi:protein kinase [Mucilaginibacter rubeus]|uniref:Protein kinase n=1 Tax=Mucilaginibacter rubeus TaxID=2027860 RepID=A0AAE6JER4_9SPHI|nr:MULTISPECIES: protein kinase [Mucilaginibacter]QEM03735.1 protein kinase [Mucilaginibacter rubeus]QEM16346.1 protein kinase [Mucilaginibacter gossypii]QTE40887.1 protein kinase [Mucilaginibacter rubeus]QTE47490.1 protein kinase [Mucilaginibacter rubeus]QTE58882.1 protein kinase [Mucilaginibacter rubeus]